MHTKTHRAVSLRRLLSLAAALAAASGCIDPISLDVEGEEGRLVVEASVTEGPGPHLVRLSYSADFERGLGALQEVVTGARVTVTRDDGAAFAVVDRGLGAYTTEPGALVGEVGRSYALRVELPDGRVFESTSETMRPAPPVERAYAGFRADSALVGTTLAPRPAIVLFAEAANPTGEANYYRWTWSGEFRATVIFNIVESETCYFPSRGRSLIEVADDRLVGAATLPPQRVESFLLTRDGRDFLQAYALTVEQQALTPEAYAYWEQIRDTRDRTGGLFDPPPSAVIGNVANVDDELDYALGYFTVAGVSRAETCARLSDFPDRPPFTLRPYLGRCEALGGSLVPTEAYDVCRDLL